MIEQFTHNLNWVAHETLVQEGFSDAWHVRVNNKRLEGVYTLEQIAQIQSEQPRALIETASAEVESDEKTGSSTWTPVRSSKGLCRKVRTLLLLLSLAVGTWICDYVFKTNHGSAWIRLLWGISLGSLAAAFVRTAFNYFFGSLVRFFHLLNHHGRAFLRGALIGSSCALTVGVSLWNFAFGFWPGMIVACLGAVLVGTLSGLAFAEQKHNLLARNLQLPALPGRSSRSWSQSLARIMLVASFVTLATTQIPSRTAGLGFDGSWSRVLDYAHQKHWQFGLDIVYTYGPLGFLTSPYYSAYASVSRLAAKTLLSFAAALGICLLGWQLSIFWKWLLIGLFTFFAGAIYVEGSAYGATDFSVYTGLLSWGILCSLATRTRVALCCLVFVSLAVFASLVKVSFIIPSFLGIAAIAGSWLLRGSGPLGWSVAIGYPLGLIATWLLAGQAPRNLRSFFIQSFEIAQGYQDAMLYELGSGLTYLASAAALATLAVVVLALVLAFRLGIGRPSWDRVVLCGWLGCLLFVVWKYGMVRSGQAQLEVFIGFLPVMVLTMFPLALRGVRYAAWRTGLALSCVVAGFVLLDATFYHGFAALCFCEPIKLLPGNTRCLLSPTKYWSAEATVLPLPRIKEIVKQATVDVFGCNQAPALLNNLNYFPRPVFQTLAAYNAPLMLLNENFYLSKRAPDYVLFELEPLDRRFPPLEDSMVLRDLLIDYAPVGSEGPFLLLKSFATDASRLKLVQQGTLSLQERIPLPADREANFWLEIELKPSLLGRILRLLYKPPPTGLLVWGTLKGGDPARFNGPAPMLAAGFLASPLLLGNGDVERLYAGQTPSRPKAYSVEIPPGTRRFWQSTFHFRIYEIGNTLGRRSSTQLESVQPIP